MTGKEGKTRQHTVKKKEEKKSFHNFIPVRRHGRIHTAQSRESQEVWMAHNIWKDLNFEMGWLLNCCNHGFSGFLVPQRREMKNNIWQSLDLESFLLFQEEREKKNFRLSRLNSYLAFFFSSCSAGSESPTSIFSQTHFGSKGLSPCLWRKVLLERHVWR